MPRDGFTKVGGTLSATGALGRFFKEIDRLFKMISQKATTGEDAADNPLNKRQLFRRSVSVATSDELAGMRRSLRDDLDAAPDFAVDGSHVVFFGRVVTVETSDSFSNAPHDTVLSLSQLVSRPVDGTVSAAVRQCVKFKIGSNVVPVFSLVSGGSGRTLFTFKCVFESCGAFLDIRTSASGDRVKWAVMGVSHSHDFAAFPSRMPRNTIPDSVKAGLERMVAEKPLLRDQDEKQPAVQQRRLPERRPGSAQEDERRTGSSLA